MIGERMKSARHAKGLSLRALADRVGVSAMALSKYETGKMTPSSPVMLKLSQVLERKVEYFFRPVEVRLTLAHVGRGAR